MKNPLWCFELVLQLKLDYCHRIPDCRQLHTLQSIHCLHLQMGHHDSSNWSKYQRHMYHKPNLKIRISFNGLSLARSEILSMPTRLYFKLNLLLSTYRDSKISLHNLCNLDRFDYFRKGIHFLDREEHIVQLLNNLLGY